ncbi:signal peptidase I [Bacillus sp. EAC]|uniref:signal peptidase I n=1 Tax=Bacillus sp. EAC TaxID=1978338 RepID=UPI000B45516B|nr:signal peptidase I [Bacillus sp. EAC]
MKNVYFKYVKLVFLILSLLIILPILIGYKPYIVLTNSMNPTIPKWSIAISKKSNPTHIKKGDILFFKYKNETRPVMHRVNSVKETKSGISYEMKGDANKHVDFILVQSEKVYGKYIYHIPLIGYLVYLIKPYIALVILLIVSLTLLLILKKKQ